MISAVRATFAAVADGAGPWQEKLKARDGERRCWGARVDETGREAVEKRRALSRRSSCAGVRFWRRCVSRETELFMSLVSLWQLLCVVLGADVRDCRSLGCGAEPLGWMDRFFKQWRVQQLGQKGSRHRVVVRRRCRRERRPSWVAVLRRKDCKTGDAG